MSRKAPPRATMASRLEYRQLTNRDQQPLDESRNTSLQAARNVSASSFCPTVGPRKTACKMNDSIETGKIVPVSPPRPGQAPFAKRWGHAPSIWLYELRSRQTPALAGLLIITFLAYFYAADLKGIWNDDAVRLTIANGGIAAGDLENRYPKGFSSVIAANGIYATQPAYLLLVNCILRLTRSYSVVPIVTTNLLIFLLSGVGIYLLARRLVPLGWSLLAAILYLWNGLAMAHVLQVREYPLILCFWFSIPSFSNICCVCRLGNRKQAFGLPPSYIAPPAPAPFTLQNGPLSFSGQRRLLHYLCCAAMS